MWIAGLRGVCRPSLLRLVGVKTRPHAPLGSTAAHARFHNTSGVGPHGARVSRKVHHADVPHPRFLQEPKSCVVLGAPMTWGQPKAGTDNGPEMIRRAGLSQELGKLGWAVEDLGDIAIDPPSASDPQGDPAYLNQMKNCYAVGKGCEQVFKTVSKQAADGKFVLTVGGDHSIGAGTVAGILQARPNTGVIWVDAHADINTPDVSESGNIHGMPVAFLMRLLDVRKYPGWEWMEGTPLLRPQQIVYIGLRDVDAGKISSLIYSGSSPCLWPLFFFPFR
jgi:arginase